MDVQPGVFFLLNYLEQSIENIDEDIHLVDVLKVILTIGYYEKCILENELNYLFLDFYLDFCGVNSSWTSR